MSLSNNLKLFSQAVGTDIGALLKSRGDLSALTTTEKSNLVAAINELVTSLTAVQALTTGLIDDTAASTTHVYSSDKIVDLLAALKDDILGGVGSAYDTLKEIADKLGEDDNALTALLTNVNGKVSFVEAQTLTVAQQQQAADNIGIGDLTVDLVGFYTAAVTAASA